MYPFLAVLLSHMYTTQSLRLVRYGLNSHALKHRTAGEHSSKRNSDTCMQKHVIHICKSTIGGITSLPFNMGIAVIIATPSFALEHP